MIYHNGNKVGELFLGKIPIIEVYYKRKFNAIEKIWDNKNSSPIMPIIDEILSCYYNRYWIDEYPWTDDTPWAD